VPSKLLSLLLEIGLVIVSLILPLPRQILINSHGGFPHPSGE
jgi:hypothetical protein